MEDTEISQKSSVSYLSSDSKLYINEDLIKMDKKPSYGINNIIAMIFIGLVIFQLFGPIEILNESEMAGLTFVLLLLFGVVAGFSFLNRMYKLTKLAHPAVKVLGIVVGIGGGIFIAIVGFFAGFIGSFRGSSMSS